MKQTKIVLSKTIKLPIENISFSNQQVSVTIEYDPKDFDLLEAVDDLNQTLNILQENEPSWITQKKLPLEEKKEGEKNE